MVDYRTTKGTVLSSEVGIGQSVNHTSAGVSSRLKEMYFPNVHYEYRVNGTDYENDNFWQERVQINQIEKIEALVAKYPAGSSVTVYYNPDNPSNSFLESLPEVNFRPMIIGIAIVALLIIVGISALIFMLAQG